MVIPIHPWSGFEWDFIHPMLSLFQSNLITTSVHLSVPGSLLYARSGCACAGERMTAFEILRRCPSPRYLPNSGPCMRRTRNNQSCRGSISTPALHSATVCQKCHSFWWHCNTTGNNRRREPWQTHQRPRLQCFSYLLIFAVFSVGLLLVSGFV